MLIACSNMKSSPKPSSGTKALSAQAGLELQSSYPDLLSSCFYTWGRDGGHQAKLVF